MSKWDNTLYKVIVFFFSFFFYLHNQHLWCPISSIHILTFKNDIRTFKANSYNVSFCGRKPGVHAPSLSPPSHPRKSGWGDESFDAKKSIKKFSDWGIFDYYELFAHALNLGFSSSVSTCTGVKSRMKPKILWSSRLGPVLKMFNDKCWTKHNATISSKSAKEGRSFFWIRITFQNEKENYGRKEE